MLNKKKIGETITIYRKRAGMTQKDLADVLHISYQAVSKWESGTSLPTVEMLCEIAGALRVSTDTILQRGKWVDKAEFYRETGLDTEKLYFLKDQLESLASEDENLLNARYMEPVIYRTDVSGMEEPVHAMVMAIPGSKEKFARERGFDREICADVAANGMNHILAYGMKPVVLRGMVVCGNNNNEQLRNMAESLKKICEENGVLFSGMEIGAQPMHYKPEEYHIQVGVTGVGDRAKLVTGENIREGDVVLGLVTEGINSVNYPLFKVLMDRRPELAHAKIDGERYFSDELLKPNTAFCRGLRLLAEDGIPHGIFKNNNLVCKKMERRIPQGLAIRIDLGKMPVLPLYRFLMERELMEAEKMPFFFQMGIGMIVVVPEEKAETALELLGRYHVCYPIGRVEKCGKEKYAYGKIRAEGKLVW